MHPPYVILNKEVGQTPLEALHAWKRDHPSYASVPLTYAGRLDPIASGKLLVLVGEECKKQEAYRGLDKEYEIEVLLDLATDTGDVLGIPTYHGTTTVPTRSDIRTALSRETGTKEVPYPAFSSKTVDGVPLFHYALEGTLGNISIPVHTETVHHIKYITAQYQERDVLQEHLDVILSHVPRAPEASKTLGADFRQDQIRAAWERLFADIPERNFLILTLQVTCGSGTYMRTLAERLGNQLGTTGMALSIRRTKIGRYHQLPFCGFWSKRY